MHEYLIITKSFYSHKIHNKRNDLDSLLERLFTFDKVRSCRLRVYFLTENHEITVCLDYYIYIFWGGGGGAESM